LAKIVKKPEGKKEGEVINEIALDEID